MKKFDQRGALDMMLVVALVVVIAVGGFVMYRINETNSDEDDTTPVASQMDVEDVGMLPADLSGIKSLEEIQTIAATEAGEASIVGIELETEDDKTVYVIHLSDGSTLWFDAGSGEAVTVVGDDEHEGGDEAIPADFVPGVSIQDAINAAKSERPGSDVKKVEIEVEDGEVVYSVRFTDDSRVDVDAATGDIVDVRTKDDEDEHDEDGHEHNEDEDEHEHDDEDEGEHEDDEEDEDDDEDDEEDE